jgi:UDP-N-acetylglucosamine:LPS N-acetylglucosamine transferase
MIKVTLLYGKSGGGHLSLARATAQALNRHFPGKYVFQLFDPMPAVAASTYKRLSSQMQKLWKFSYELTNTTQFSSFLHDITSLTTTDKLVAHIKKFKPDIVITNYPFVTTEMHSALKKAGSHAKTAVLFADPFTPHESWFNYTDADLYLSSTREVAELAADHGIPTEKIQVVGWPTRSEFLMGPQDKKAARENLGLNPEKFTVFIGGAGQGGGKIFDVCEAVLTRRNLVKSCQVIVNPGVNPGLTYKIMKLAQILPQFFYVIPLAHNMHTLLSASDIVVGKAGPNFLFEAIHTLRPILATGCLPGQEEGNLAFIKKAGIGWVQENPAKAASLMENLYFHPKAIAEFTPRLEKIKSQHLDATRNIAREIDKLVS